MTDKTVGVYLDILCGTFVARRLAPWFENVAKRQVKSPKVYLADSGMLHSLLGINEWLDLLGHPNLAIGGHDAVVDGVAVAGAGQVVVLVRGAANEEPRDRWGRAVVRDGRRELAPREDVPRAREDVAAGAAIVIVFAHLLEVHVERVQEFLQCAHEHAGTSVSAVARLLRVEGEYRKFVDFLRHHGLGVHDPRESRKRRPRMD